MYRSRHKKYKRSPLLTGLNMMDVDHSVDRSLSDNKFCFCFGIIQLSKEMLLLDTQWRRNFGFIISGFYFTYIATYKKIFKHWSNELFLDKNETRHFELPIFIQNFLASWLRLIAAPKISISFVIIYQHKSDFTSIIIHGNFDGWL